MKVFANWFFVIFILCFNASAADDVFEIYRPKYRQANELVGSVKDLFGDRVRVTSFREKIVIRGEKANTEKVRNLLAQLDVKPRVFRIETRGRVRVTARSSAAGASGRVNIGDKVNVRIGDRPKRGGARGRYRNGSVDVSGRASARTAEANSAGTNFVQIMEGEQAVLVNEGDDQSAGVVVTPFLRGDQIQLKVSRTQVSTVAGKSTTVNTRLFVPMNQWFNIGGSNSSSSVKEGRILSSAGTATDSSSNIFVKVRLEN